jgi:hypothetical protein
MLIAVMPGVAIKSSMLSIVLLSVIMLSVIMPIVILSVLMLIVAIKSAMLSVDMLWYNEKCHYAEYHYDECHGTCFITPKANLEIASLSLTCLWIDTGTDYNTMKKDYFLFSATAIIFSDLYYRCVTIVIYNRIIQEKYYT